MDAIVIKITNYNKGIEEILYHIKEIDKPLKTQKGKLDLKNIKTIISFDFANIINDLPLRNDIHYFDLEKINRQLIGKSKKEFSPKEYPWVVWNAIKKLDYTLFKVSESEFKCKLKDARKFYLGVDDDINISDTIKFLMDCLECLHKSLINELQSSVEKERYYNIEIKLSPILFNATKRGINIDKSKVLNHIKEIDKELYNQRNILQLKYGIFSNNDFEGLTLNMNSKIPDNIIIKSKEFWSYLKIKRNNHQIFDTLLYERRLSKNKTVLSRLGSLESEIIYPNYDYFGTITGRILVQSPALQQLSSSYRDIILPNKGKKLLYLDFCQFEAGILASQANDQSMIEMYNKADIYDAIVDALGNDKINREQAKEVFYSYCYGMKLNNDIAFFTQFPGLTLFFENIKSEFENHGYVITEMGNRRLKTNLVQDLDSENWLISQKIQGLASIILKEIIIEIHNQYPEIEFLLPMHDAILYQVPNEKYEEYSSQLQEIFKSVLKKYCPSLNPKVAEKCFHS